MANVYETVTAQIVAALEKGTVAGKKWRRPWHTTGTDPFGPLNVVSRKPYRGINTLCLWAAAQANGWTCGEWATFQQWKQKDAHVRRGAKATLVVFWKFGRSAADTEDDAESEEENQGEERLLFTKGYHVFNAAQVEGYAIPEPLPVPALVIDDRFKSTHKFFRAIGAKVSHGGNRASYSPTLDAIRLPHYADFESPEHYYSTSAHEHCHWTGADSRLARNLEHRFGSDKYAMEELVAELGAAFLCAHLGLESQPREDHAIYLQSWLTRLKSDSRAIFVAAGKAQRAADFLILTAAKHPLTLRDRAGVEAVA